MITVTALETTVAGIVVGIVGSEMTVGTFDKTIVASVNVYGIDVKLRS
jgi:hypothetical protein